MIGDLIERGDRVRARLQGLDMAIETADRRGHDVPVLGDEVPVPARGGARKVMKSLNFSTPEPSSLRPVQGSLRAGCSLLAGSSRPGRSDW